MKKLYLKFNNVGYDQILLISSEKNSDLNLMLMSLNAIHDWISILQEDEIIYIWIDFLEEEYDSWQEIPKLELSKENYDQIIEQWNQNIENPAAYLVLSQDESGWISLEPQKELSQQDLDFLESERQEQLKYEKLK